MQSFSTAKCQRLNLGGYGPVPILVYCFEVEPDETLEAEACRAFVARAPQGGSVPAREPYAAHREAWLGACWYPTTRSSIAYRRGLEDAREAIYVGQRLGYSEADIATYLRRVYRF